MTNSDRYRDSSSRWWVIDLKKPGEATFKLVFLATFIVGPTIAAFKGFDGIRCNLPFDWLNPSRYALKGSCFVRGLQLTIPDTILDSPPPPATNQRLVQEQQRRKQEQQQKQKDLFGDNLNDDRPR